MSSTALMLMLSLATGRLKSTEEDRDVTRKLQRWGRRGCDVSAALDGRIGTKINACSRTVSRPSLPPCPCAAHSLVKGVACGGERGCEASVWGGAVPPSRLNAAVRTKVVAGCR